MASKTPQATILHDLAVRFQVYLERVKANEVRALDPALRALDRAVREALAGVVGTPSRARLATVLLGLRKKADKVLAQHMAAQVKLLRELATYAGQYSSDTIRLVLPPGAPPMAAPLKAAEVWAAVVASPVQATGELLEPFLATWGKKAISRIEGAIRTGYAQGKTAEQIIRTIRGTKAANYMDGLLGGITKREAGAVVRTALQAVSSASAQAVYASNADLGDSYQWISTLDNVTSIQCRSLDHRIFKVGKGPVPPIHINCRSITIFVIKGVALLDNVQRASKGAKGGAQVAGRLTYYEWLKTQPLWFQEDTLGKTRAQLFRDGGLSADEFARLQLDKNFAPLTLEQMRKRNPAAFHRAGL